MSNRRWFWIFKEGKIPIQENALNITKSCSGISSVHLSMWVDFQYYGADECSILRDQIGTKLFVLQVQ